MVSAGNILAILVIGLSIAQIVISDLRQETKELGKRHVELTAALATNVGIDANLRGEILEFEQRFQAVSNTVVDLEAWSADRERRRRIAEMEENQKTKQREEAARRLGSGHVS